MADEKNVIEAALFSAGKPMSVGEIAAATGMDEAAVRKAMRSLLKVYRVRETALEIAKIGARYSLQLKSEYLAPTQAVARKELPLPVLKIAALVGYYQPMHKKDLVEMVGPKSWEHVLTLEKLGLLQVKRTGHGYSVTTTPKYAEYFGLAAKSREDIKRILASRAGIARPEQPKADAASRSQLQGSGQDGASVSTTGVGSAGGAASPGEPSAGADGPESASEKKPRDAGGDASDGDSAGTGSG